MIINDSIQQLIRDLRANGAWAALAPTPQPAASSASEAAAPAAALWQGTPLPSVPGTAQ